MNGIGISNNIMQTQKLSYTNLVVDFVVASSKTNRKLEEKTLELIRKKSESEAKKTRQKDKNAVAAVEEKRTLKKEKIKSNTENGKVKDKLKTEKKTEHKINIKI